VLAHGSLGGHGIAPRDRFEQVAVLFGDHAHDDGGLDHGSEAWLEDVDDPGTARAGQPVVREVGDQVVEARVGFDRPCVIVCCCIDFLDEFSQDEYVVLGRAGGRKSGERNLEQHARFE
jgi:hypothetical protein